MSYSIAALSEISPKLALFPLFGITPEGTCACGRAECTRVGKHPAVEWSKLGTAEKVRGPAGHGIATGTRSGLFVLDVDSDDALLLANSLGGCDETLTIKTSKGWHFYFEHPGFHVKTCAGDLGRGLDIRGEGGFVVAPGSPHASGATYDVAHEAPPAPAPEWLLTWLRAQKAPSEARHYPGDVGGEELVYRRDLYAEYLRDEAPPCVEGQGGDQTLFNVVQRGAYDLALPVDDVLELVREHYDPRCSPAWGDELEERVQHKAHDAKTNSTRPRAEPLPADLRHLGQARQAPPAAESGVQLTTASNDTNASPIASIESKLKITWGRWDEPLPPAVYIVDGFVPAATIGAIVAKGSSLKTWLVISLLSSVASGLPWLGHFAVQQSPTLLVDFESGRDIIHERVQYLQAAGAANLGIASFPDGRIDDAVFWKELAAVVQHHGIKLAAIDSFANGATGVDENDAKAALPLQLATTFVEATGCAVVFIHHAKKGDSSDERDLVRGSGAIFGAADWIYTMIPQDEDRTKMLVRNIKAFRRKTPDFHVALTPGGLVLDAVASEEETDKQQAAALRAAIVGLLSRGPQKTKHMIDTGIGKQKNTSAAVLDEMIVAREVVRLPGRGYTLDYPAARRERIRQACGVPGLKTPEKLAKAAHVGVDEVHALLKDGQLSPSGSGFVYLAA